ncbi:MAG TPA: hypothetical protein VIR16_04530 [Candidatus Limnocylindrales bacterium]
MSDQPTSVLDEASLAENRAGRLSDAQRGRLASFARNGRKNELALTLVLGMVAAVMFIGRGPAGEATQRLLVGGACVVGAIVFLVRGLTGADALSRDLGDPHVDRVEGAVERQEVRTTGGHSSSAPPMFYLAVGGHRYHAFRDAYDASPEAGYVALYVLRHSGRVVNLERLPEPALPAGALDRPMDLVHAVAPNLGSHDQVARAEARAALAELAGAEKARVEASAVRGAVPPPNQRDSRPLSDSLPGTWAGAGAKAVFRTDGTAVMTWFGREVDGRWSVDPHGQLHLGLAGRDQPVDAWIAGDTLTVTMEGNGFSFQRVSG